MKIIVTGGKGQLGLTLQKIAPEYPDHRFLFTDRDEADITDRESMERLLDTSEAEAVINCAAYTAVDRAENDRTEAEQINAQGPAILSRLARERDIPLLQISTDYVFSGDLRRPLCEDDLPAPRSVYGQTKLAGEEAVRASGCRGVILRTAWLYSEFGHNFVRTMLRLGREGIHPKVVSDQFGSPTYATDLAHAMIELLDRPLDSLEFYHYSNEGSISWYDFACEIFSQTGVPVRVEAITSSEYPAVAPRPAYSVLSKEKIKRLGIPVPDWQEALRRCLTAISPGSKHQVLL